MRKLIKRAGRRLLSLFEVAWHYLGSLAAVSLFAAVLGLGIYHAVVQDVAPRYYCYAGVHNPAGAEPPSGIIPLGESVSPGIPHVRLEYNNKGGLQRMKYVDAAGRLSALPGSAVAVQHLQYDSAGRLLKRENRGVTGTAVCDAQGVAVREFEYDAAGNLVCMRFRDAAGDLVMPRFPGYAESRMKYDALGRPVLVEYLDETGKPVVNAAGEQRVEYVYADDDKEVSRRNYIDGALADNCCGVAQEVYHVTETGAERHWLNARGERTLHRGICASSVICDTCLSKGITRRRYIGTSGKEGIVTPVCAEYIAHCNAEGKPVWECFGGVDGLPVDNPACGYAERACVYDARGELEWEYFWDACGNPAAVCEVHHVPTPQGNYALSLHADGATSVQPK